MSEPTPKQVAAAVFLYMVGVCILTAALFRWGYD